MFLIFFTQQSEVEQKNVLVEPKCGIESMKPTKQTRVTAADSNVAGTSKKRSQLEHYFTKTSTSSIASEEPESKRNKVSLPGIQISFAI